MKIKSKIKDYSCELVDGVLNKKEKCFSGFKHDRLFYFVDDAVFKLYEDKIKNFIGDDFCLRIEADENNKEYHKMSEYYKVLIDKRITRNDILVTFGGGILQDISGFIASTLYRGLKWVFFPTTLLAQADSCIGSKTSINFNDSKNLIGTFYPPDSVFVDGSFCDTLSDNYFNSGVGEIIKFHILSGADGYQRLNSYLALDNLRDAEKLNEITLSTLDIKKAVFDEDEFDKGKRNLFNYGHCFGHALESASNFEICHGEAVLVGMGFANLLSVKRGLMTQEKYDEFEVIFKRFYPKFDYLKIRAKELIKYLKQDKKRVTKDLTMVLGEDVGKFKKYDDVKEEEVNVTYKEFQQIV